MKRRYATEAPSRRIDATPTKAHFTGECDVCLMPYGRDALIVRTRKGWAHAHCDDERGIS